MSRDLTLELASIRDGKVSIEHQIDIHVNDLFGIQNNPQLSLDDVLSGLHYVVDYRLKGGRLPNLDADLMKRLCKGLLFNMKYTEGGLLKRKLTAEAQDAFILFGEFLEEVEEFRQAVAQENVSDLCDALRLHRRCRNDAPPEVKQAAIAIIHMLTEWFPQFSDWHEFVKEDDHSDVEKVLKGSTSTIKKPLMPVFQGALYPPPSLYFDRNVTRLLKMFRTSLTEGLDTASVQDRYKHYGPNKLPDPPKPSIIKMLLHQLTDFMVLILLAASIVTAAEKDFKAMAVLLVVIVLNTVIGFTQEYKANKALEALKKLNVAQAQVIRDGQKMVINSSELVPGDIVILEEGDAIPADVRIVEAASFHVVESILTGESVPVLKNTKKVWTKTRHLPLADCKGNAFMSTMVAKGRAKGLVVRTGNNTEIGKISAAITSVPNVQTPIQRKLATLGKWLVVLAVLLCALVVAIGIAYARNTRDTITIGISLAVSVIPEGLVAVTTVTMAIGVRRMAARNAIVRTLPSVETLGSVTVICSDKTGTLTEGKMGPTELWTADDSLYSFTEPTSLDPNRGQMLRALREYKQQPKSSVASLILTESAAVKKEKKEILQEDNPQEVSKDIKETPAAVVTALMITALCNNASVVPDDTKGSGYKGIGDPTEVALVIAAQKGGFPKDYWEKQKEFKKIYEKPFDSERKLMSVAYEVPESIYTDAEVDVSPNYKPVIVLAKGAPEQLLQKCTARLPASTSSPQTSFNIQPVPLDDSFGDLVSEQSSRMAAKGLRVLGLAYKRVSVLDKDSLSSDDTQKDDTQEDVTPTVNDAESVEPVSDPAFAENGLTFVGLIGLIDPPRKGVAESIAKCKNAGIKVIMITGDHAVTATAIATDIGICEPGVLNMSRTIRGAELDLLSDEAIAELKPFPSVFARVSPDNKLKIVKALQALGNSVAMTGDGVNDAPAIKAADVGVAMGMGGTEITKQAADIVLANDDFSTIVAAVEEGRQVFDNILKFIVYLLSCNGAEIVLMLLCTIINIDLPFTTIMILWANIIADIPPAMSLGVEPAENDIMKRRPRNPKSPVLSKMVTSMIIAQAFAMALLTFGTYKIALDFEHIPLEDARSLAFATLTTLQLFQGFLSRTVNESVFKTGILGNKWMIASVLGSWGLLILGIYTPGIRQWLSLTPVPIFGWGKIAICFVILSLISETVKVIARRVRDVSNRAPIEKV
ncbi:10270_t:CDS:10 [Paraglomus occultum]|uniref:10270_t:CDS:1 n=1 Tax=Paraglomus occultum TaxID=144539 RepID=A0A9N9AWH0_9GLOM|nr:10270_t:CDS:10 [Paraglomus occultum]